LLTISRRLVRQLRTVMRRAFGARGHGPAVCFTAAPGTLNVRAKLGNIAVEYTAAGEQPADTLWVPFQLLDDCQGKKDEPVNIERTGKGRVTAQWRDGSVPQTVRYDADPPRDAEFPSPPETFAENPPGLLEALAAAADTCDADSVRFATDHVQLRGEAGSIAATDGRQLLVQNGFQFPWTGEVLVPRTKIFASAELPHDQPVRAGKSGDWVAVQCGSWTVYLAVNADGRFPDVRHHIPKQDAATTRCVFSPADADFLVETLPRLPSEDENNYPVTLDVNGQIAIRAKPADSGQPTEVVLTGSSSSGEAIRVNLNRHYLVRAMRLGFRELNFTDDKTPILGRDSRREYVWAPLEPKAAIPPAKNAIRIESPLTGTETQTAVSPPRPQRRTKPVSQPNTNANGNGQAQSNGQTQASSQPPANGQAAKTNGQARRAGRKLGREDVAGLIRQAEATRAVLRDALLKTSELVKALKQHGRRNRAIQNTLASLRQLKTLGV